MGALYPRYTGHTLDLFYCPSNTDAGPDRPTDPRAPARTHKKLFLYNYARWRQGSPGWVKPNDTFNCPIGGYAYGLPLALGKSPRDGTKTFYPEESMMSAYDKWHPPVVAGNLGDPRNFSGFYQYMMDAGLVSSKIGPVGPVGTRGKYPLQAIMTDCYFGGYRGYHINGWNALFSDFHAKRVGDPVKRIDDAGGSPFNYTGPAAGGGQSGADVYVAWDWLSKHP